LWSLSKQQCWIFKGFGRFNGCRSMPRLDTLLQLCPEASYEDLEFESRQAGEWKKQQQALGLRFAPLKIALKPSSPPSRRREFEDHGQLTGFAFRRSSE